MSDTLSTDLGLPRPDNNLEVGSDTPAAQTVDVMKRFKPALDEHKPACVLVARDVNSTLACTRVAVKKGVPVGPCRGRLASPQPGSPNARRDQTRVHRSGCRSPAHHRAQCGGQGIDDERIVFTGNVMIDSLLACRDGDRLARVTLSEHGIDPALLSHPSGYGVVTLQRPSNFDDAACLKSLLEVFSDISEMLPLVFACTRSRASISTALVWRPYLNLTTWPSCHLKAIWKWWD